MKDLLTIVIPCKNENSILIETLNCLKDQEDIEGTKIINHSFTQITITGNDTI